jgi:serine protease Do
MAALLACLGWAQKRPAATQLQGISQVVEELVERVDPAVVQILTSGLAPSEEVATGLLKTARTSGSGVIVDASGYIVTNAHVVSGGRKVQVVIPLRHEDAAKANSILKPSGRAVAADVVGVDSETDVAVLKVEEKDLPRLEFADSEKLRQGQVVFAFGSPYGLENSVSMGIVSSVARQIKPDHPMIYVQTDAAINPGNSGGPLVDLDGRIAGLNTFILSGSGGSEGIGFAVPSNIVRRVYDQIRKDGYVRRGQAGVIAQTITPAMAQALSLPQDYGVFISDVLPDGAAAAAGVQVKDIIASLNGKPMENARQFGVNIYQMAGETVTVEVRRGGENKTLKMAVMERPRDPARLLRSITRRDNYVARLSVLAATLDEKITPVLGPTRRLSGVVVAALLAGSAAEGTLLPGDLIYEVNGSKVGSLDELRQAVTNLPANRPAALWIERAGQLQIVMIDLE